MKEERAGNGNHRGRNACWKLRDKEKRSFVVRHSSTIMGYLRESGI